MTNQKDFAKQHSEGQVVMHSPPGQDYLGATTVIITISSTTGVMKVAAVNPVWPVSVNLTTTTTRQRVVASRKEF